MPYIGFDSRRHNHWLMTDIFNQHLQKFIDINEAEFANILSYFSFLEVNKKENLLTEGDICKTHYFVLNGCLRMFFINDKGVEQTTQFAIEHWWITDNMAYEHQQPSAFYIQAVEHSHLLKIDHPDQEKLLRHFPKMERYFRFIYQRAYAASQRRVRFLYEFSREELYHHFNDRYPEFVQRLPQYLIASYLGFTPEYLSEIRSKARS